ncbi:C2H2 finger domain protein [Xylaria sp. FL0043]|nr:C2H2 finger domain protein [Xylaria sp. FL0043]
MEYFESSDDDYTDSGEPDLSEDEYIDDGVADDLDEADQNAAVDAALAAYYDVDAAVEADVEADVEAGIEANVEADVEADYDDPLFDGNAYPPEYYLRNIQNTNDNMFKQKQYSAKTLKVLEYVKQQWIRFCLTVLKTDWMASLKKICIRVAIQFCNWQLHQKLSKSERAKPAVKKHNTLRCFWDRFRLVFELCMGHKIDSLIASSYMVNALRSLSHNHGLSHEKRDNRAMSIEDIKHYINTALRTDQKNFKLGEQRILAVLFFLLLAPAGARPSSILELRFRDISVSLVRDPKGGRHRLLVRISLVRVKAYLDPKDEKSFLLPEVIHEPTLLLSPHVFLLGILIRHRAFQVDALNDVRNISKLNIHQGENELLLPLRHDLDNKFIFRRVARDYSGKYQICDDRISLPMITQWVERIGKLAGFKNTTVNYCLRYMAGNSLDQNAGVSSSLRNLVMGHAPNSTTFQRHYLSRTIRADLWAIHQDLEPQQELIQRTASHGYLRSSRRPIELTDAQSAALKRDPKLVRMTKDRDACHRGTPERKKISHKIKARVAKLQRAEIARVRREWDEQQAVRDITGLIEGRDPDEGTALETGTANMPLIQAQMINALEDTVVVDTEQQLQRKANAINMIAEYCLFQESKTKNKIVAPAPAPAELQLPAQDRLRELRQSVQVEPNKKIRRCFVCVGNALQVEPDDDNERYSTFCREFYSNYEAARHFMRTHLSTLKDDDKVRCPVCVPKVVLRHKKHFQNHAELVHGLRSQTRNNE